MRLVREPLPVDLQRLAIERFRARALSGLN